MNSVTPGSLARTQGSQPSAPSLTSAEISANAVKQSSIAQKVPIIRPTGAEPPLASGRVAALVDRFSQVPKPLPPVSRQAAQHKVNGFSDRVSCFVRFSGQPAPAAPPKPQLPIQQALPQQHKVPPMVAQTVVPIAQSSISQGSVRITSKPGRPIREALPCRPKIKPTIIGRDSFLPAESEAPVRVTVKAEQDPSPRRSKRLAPATEEAVHDTSMPKEQSEQDLKRHASVASSGRPKVNNHRHPPTKNTFKNNKK